MDFTKNEELISFLNMDIKEKGAIDDIFKIIMDYLNTFKELEFDYALVIPFNVIMNKFINCSKYLGADTQDLTVSIDDFLKFSIDNSKYKNVLTPQPTFLAQIFNQNYFKKRFVSIKDENRKSKENLFFDIYNNALLIYNSIKDFRKKEVGIELGGFFNPDLSNKVFAKNLIIDAITLINKDTSLSEKAKKSIIDYLNNAISEFEKPNSNWTLIFGKLKESIFVLGALGSLVGGVAGSVSLFEAKQKLEQATETLEKTSINVNYENINQLFNVKTNVYIEYNEPKLLIDGNKQINSEDETVKIEND